MNFVGRPLSVDSPQLSLNIVGTRSQRVILGINNPLTDVVGSEFVNRERRLDEFGVAKIKQRFELFIQRIARLLKKRS